MRGSDFLSRTEADQNPELLRRERRETVIGEGREGGFSSGARDEDKSTKSERVEVKEKGKRRERITDR